MDTDELLVIVSAIAAGALAALHHPFWGVAVLVGPTVLAAVGRKTPLCHRLAAQLRAIARTQRRRAL